MQGQAVIGFRESREQSVLQHCPRARPFFLGGLTDHHQRSLPTILQRRQQARGACEHRHVDVMSAGVHHVHFASRVVNRAGPAGIGKAGQFLDWQRVQIGAHQDRRTAPVAQNPHHTVAAHPGGNFQPGFLQFVGDALACLFFVKRKFRVRVQLLVELEQLRIFPVHPRLNLGAQLGGGRVLGAHDPCY